MKMRWLLIPLLMLLSGSVFADGNYIEGVNYVPVTPAQQTDVKPGQIEVIEFYWYGCPHCFALEPYIEAWEKSGKPANVVFKRVPASMKDSEFYVDAQAAFVADILGVGDKVREPFFNAIHLDDDEALRTDKGAIRDFFAKYGVKPADFDATWDSFGVQSRLASAQQLGNRYQVQGVPTVIVNGKWKTGAGYQMAPQDIMKCVEFLIAREQPASGKHK